MSQFMLFDIVYGNLLHKELAANQQETESVLDTVPLFVTGLS